MVNFLHNRGFPLSSTNERPLSSTFALIKKSLQIECTPDEAVTNQSDRPPKPPDWDQFGQHLKCKYATLELSMLMLCLDCA